MYAKLLSLLIALPILSKQIYIRYNNRRIEAMLRQDGWQVNHKRVERIWKREGLRC